MADRVVIMQGGAIQQIASPDTLFNDPANLFVAGFIGSPGMNFLNAEARGGQLRLFGQNIALDRPRGEGPVVVGLRPEHLTLGEAPVRFPVRPVLVESLGSEKYIYFDDAAARRVEGENDRSKGLIARVAHSGALPADGELTLGFDPARLYLFDATTGERL